MEIKEKKVWGIGNRFWCLVLHSSSILVGLSGKYYNIFITLLSFLLINQPKNENFLYLSPSRGVLSKYLYSENLLPGSIVSCT